VLGHVRFRLPSVLVEKTNLRASVCRGAILPDGSCSQASAAPSARLLHLVGRLAAATFVFTALTKPESHMAKHIQCSEGYFRIGEAEGLDLEQNLWSVSATLQEWDDEVTKCFCRDASLERVIDFLNLSSL